MRLILIYRQRVKKVANNLSCKTASMCDTFRWFYRCKKRRRNKRW